MDLEADIHVVKSEPTAEIKIDGIKIGMIRRLGFVVISTGK